MAEVGIELVETAVGDRYVMEQLLSRKALLGGEQSGHIIFLDRANTGDGLLTAVRLLDVMAGTGKSLAELRHEAITEYPQVLHNVRVSRHIDLTEAQSLWDEVSEVEEELGSDGRVLVRLPWFMLREVGAFVKDFLAPRRAGREGFQPSPLTVEKPVPRRLALD